MKRDYQQHCAIAKALDVVGSRWTLLLIRELLPGPRRFKDLQAGLPGIGTNLLSDRLRHLEEEGVIEKRVLPPPAGSTVYELTPLGRQLEGIVLDLSRWGWRRLDPRDPGDSFHPRWMLMAMKTANDPEAAAGVHETYEFRVGDEVFHVRVDDGEIRGFDGPAIDPDLVVTSDLESMLRLSDGPHELQRALEEGRIEAEGADEAERHCREIFQAAFSRDAAALPIG